MKLWMRWAWRDLKDRWLQVVATALIIALGTGLYAGMGSNKPWRQKSYDASYALLHMYDLRIQLPQNSYLDTQTFLAAVQSIPHAAWIDTLEPRLFLPTLVDTSTDHKTVMTPGVLIGVDVADGGPHVNGIYAKTGRSLTAEDAAQDTAVLDYHFANYYHLKSSGDLTVSGNTRLHYVGSGLSPEFFSTVNEKGDVIAAGSYAPIFISLQTAQALSGHPGMANDFVLTLTKGANVDTVRSEIESAITTALPGLSLSMESRNDNQSYKGFYNDINNDQQTYTLIALLFLGGAAFGVFNLTGRMVEAQRRQIGIGMALGVPPRQLAIRPLLVGAQIAILGGIFGLGFGLLLSRGFVSLLSHFQPLPVWDTSFQISVFLKAAALGIAIPFAATIYPVWRAVRVTPVDAIKTGYLVAKGGGFAPFVSRLPLPGKSFTQMPFRNLLRAPRRSLLTLMGIAIAISVLIALFGMFDSLSATLDKSEKEMLQNHPQRMTVYLDNFYPSNSTQASAVTHSSLLSMAEPGLILDGSMIHGGTKLDASIELLDLNSPLWKPTLEKGSRSSAGLGILISEKASRDLGVSVGDTLTLEHPSLQGQSASLMTQTEVRVTGIDGNPTRSSVYIDISQAPAMGMDGLVNVIQVYPAAGVTQNDIQRAMLQQPGVAYVIAVADSSEAVRALFNQLTQIMTITNGILLLMTFLIAFNTTSINVDERAREIATMFAFGLRIRTVIRMAMLENLVAGILSTLLGTALGLLMLRWLINASFDKVMPDLGLYITVSSNTLLIAVLFGVVVAALTPLLSIRKMLRMNIPSTLRVME